MGEETGWTGAGTQQFWSQIAQWSLRRLENADYTVDVSLDKGAGQISVEAVDAKGDYQNFLDLQAIVATPKGQSITVPVKQTGPGHYEAEFATKEIGTYMVNLLTVNNGQTNTSQRVGASINYSPEFNTPEPNLNLLRRLAESGGGKLLDLANPADSAFLHDRRADLSAAGPVGMALEGLHSLVSAGCRRAADPA